MDPLERLNTLLHSAEYADLNPSTSPILRLRTARQTTEIAQEITHLLWADLLRGNGGDNLDAHRFPALAHALTDVLHRHLGECVAWVEADQGDPWADTGGGAPTPKQRPPACDEHITIVLQESGPQVQHLLASLEKKTCDFFNSHEPPFDQPLTPEMARRIHQAIEQSVKPHLMKNIANSKCKDCERQWRAQIKGRVL